MSAGTIIWIVAAVLVVCCGLIHRRVIKALVRHEPLPKAPKWHCWVPKDKRRS